MLLANFDKSGIKSHSGQLRKAVANADVWLLVANINGAYRLGVALPEGEKPYESNDKTSFYRVASALNYGSVRTPQTERNIYDLPTRRVVAKGHLDILGQKAKKSVKKLLLGTGISEGSAKALRSNVKAHNKIIRAGVQISNIRDKGGIILASATTAGQDSMRPASLGGNVFGANDIIVVKPRPFFFLTDSQREETFAYIMKKLRELINEQLGRK
jgi:hypothetical protein